MTSGYVRGMSQEIYNIIYETFPDRNQANGVVSIFEKTLTQLEVNNKVEFNERLDLIISKVKEKLGEEFATKADLKAGFIELELKIAQTELKLVSLIQSENEKLRTEFKEDINGLRTEFKEDINGLRTEFKEDIKEVINKNLDDKIKSFKYSIIVWLVVTIGIGLINIFFTYFKN